MAEPNRKSVAIIGTGMAGLVAAYLLKNDKQSRYDVQLFEMQEQLSLDSASFNLKTADTSDGPSGEQRIDVPMRSFGQGYYNNMIRMYDYLGIQYTSPRFLFTLSKLSSSKNNSKDSSGSTSNPPYFVHSSSNHRIPPIRPEGLGLMRWIVEVIYLAVCYTWFISCCFLVEPQRSNIPQRDETLRHYFRRIKLPSYFIKAYVLPLVSSVATCSHETLLDFPASDYIDYARSTYRQPHFAVKGGVHKVQKTLSQDLSILYGAKVEAVENVGARVCVTWTQSGASMTQSREFDHVVMAVTPDVVGALYQPLKGTLSMIPTNSGEAVVYSDYSSLPDCDQSINQLARETGQKGVQTRVLHIISNDTASEPIESVHGCRSAFVVSFPIMPIEADKVIHRAPLTRVLRSRQSRHVVNRIFSPDATTRGMPEEKPLWRNGDGNVWLVGSWCWDGMVLLEGCVVSAMRLATALDVHVPWGMEGSSTI